MKIKMLIEQMKRSKGQKAITLIALIITIIVLLILAGVTIASITGENGILSKATNARDNNAKASAEERVKTEVLGSYGSDGKLCLDDLNNNLKKVDGLKYNGNAVSESNKIEKLPASVYLDGYTVIIAEQGIIKDVKTIEEAKSDDMLQNNKDTKILLDDGIVTIPAKFKVANDSATKKDEGIVVEDKNQNQFVWVPVDCKNFQRREGYYDGKPESISNCGEADENGENTKITETVTTQEEAKKMYASVKRNEGFYIGRYEAGRGNDSKAVCKKGANVYNSIKWSANGSMQETDGTTNNLGAVELSRAFSKENNYTTVTSTLIYGVQWDATINWMDNISNSDAIKSDKRYIIDSTGMGWYNNNYKTGNAMQKTGVDIVKENDVLNRVKNIYDMAGNVREWSMESCNQNARVCRGGSYNFEGTSYPASNRTNQDYVNYGDGARGFRISLYLNN